MHSGTNWSATRIPLHSPTGDAERELVFESPFFVTEHVNVLEKLFGVLAQVPSSPKSFRLLQFTYMVLYPLHLHGAAQLARLSDKARDALGRFSAIKIMNSALRLAARTPQLYSAAICGVNPDPLHRFCFSIIIYCHTYTNNATLSCTF